MTNTFTTLPLADIAPSLTNPRKSFNPVKLTELAESIKASGVHQPILVRPLPGERVPTTDRGVTHEIVAGERRYRACQQAGLADIPVLIRDMSDEQVLETQIVENLQRDDLTALEEAEGFEALQATGATVDGIAGKIGKSRSYVFARLKLLDLSMECKEAMRAGQIDASRALLIARIPDTTLQTKALAEATRADYRGEVCSVRALQSWLQANVMLKLDAAMFNIADSTLVPAVGNCTSCPKRTGASPDLFADVQSVDICTDPACFHTKEAAHRESVLAAAERRGMRLIDGDEAKAIIPHQWMPGLSGYSPLTQERTDTVDGQPATLGQLLGKDLDAAVLIENPWTKELTAAIPTDEAEAMLLARGLVKAVEAKAAKKDDIEGEIKRLKDRADKEVTKRFRDDAFAQLADVVHGCRDDLSAKLLTPNLLRAWWLRQVDEMTDPDLAELFNLELVHPDARTNEERDAQTTQIRLHVQACNSGKLYQALALHLVMDDTPDYFYGPIEPPTLFEALASELGVDLDSIESEAHDAVHDEYADEIKKLKAQLKGLVTPPATYRGPNGETWTGRGLMPRWLAVLVQNGQDKESFRVTDQVKVITTPEKSPTTGTPAAQAKGRGGKKPKTTEAQAKAQIAAALTAQEGTNPGADAQGDDGAGEQPVATSAAVAPGVAQAGFVAAWPMGMAA
jgi:ParB/RepB/Spo0J family partition protein